jgi:hypothetical protein
MPDPYPSGLHGTISRPSSTNSIQAGGARSRAPRGQPHRHGIGTCLRSDIGQPLLGRAEQHHLGVRAERLASQPETVSLEPRDHPSRGAGQVGIVKVDWEQNGHPASSPRSADGNRRAVGPESTDRWTRPVRIRGSRRYAAPMDVATTILTGLGLAGAAGLNAYIPLLLVGLVARLGLVDLTSPYDLLESPPVLVALGVLLVVEVVADKVPAVDSVNDTVQTLIRPAAGAVLFAGSVGIGSDLAPEVGLIAGLLAAGSVHATKAAARPVVNVSTAGLGGPVVSVVEDVASVVTTLVAIFLPILVLVLLALFVWLAFSVASRRQRRHARQNSRDSGSSMPRSAS